MNEQPPENSSMFKQPKAVWAVAFACVISFMGIGLVDPILPAIARQLHASPSQVSLLFTSYLLVTGFAMLLSGAVSSRIGAKLTLISGLILIIVFAGLGGFRIPFLSSSAFAAAGDSETPCLSQLRLPSLSAWHLAEAQKPLFCMRRLWDWAFRLDRLPVESLAQYRGERRFSAYRF